MQSYQLDYLRAGVGGLPLMVGLGPGRISTQLELVFAGADFCSPSPRELNRRCRDAAKGDKPCFRSAAVGIFWTFFVSDRAEVFACRSWALFFVLVKPALFVSQPSHLLLTRSLCRDDSMVSQCVEVVTRFRTGWPKRDGVAVPIVRAASWLSAHAAVMTLSLVPGPGFVAINASIFRGTDFGQRPRRC